MMASKSLRCVTIKFLCSLSDTVSEFLYVKSDECEENDWQIMNMVRNVATYIRVSSRLLASRMRKTTKNPQVNSQQSSQHSKWVVSEQKSGVLLQHYSALYNYLEIYLKFRKITR